MYRLWFHNLVNFIDLDKNGLYQWTDATAKQINGISANTKGKHTLYQEMVLACRWYGETVE